MEVKQDTTRQCLSCAFHITQMRKRQRSASRIAEIGVEGAASQRGADLVKNGRETLEVRAHLLPGVRLFPACATDIGLLPGYQCAPRRNHAHRSRWMRGEQPIGIRSRGELGRGAVKGRRSVFIRQRRLRDDLIERQRLAPANELGPKLRRFRAQIKVQTDRSEHKNSRDCSAYLGRSTPGDHKDKVARFISISNCRASRATSRKRQGLRLRFRRSANCEKRNFIGGELRACFKNRSSRG